MKDILKVTNLTKTYLMGEVTIRALAGVSFSLREGEFVVVLGPSGSGKSTMLNIIGGIDVPTTGDIIFEGDILQGKTNVLQNKIGGLRSKISGLRSETNGSRGKTSGSRSETLDVGKINQRELTLYRRAAVGFVFQFYNLIPSLTARENIQLACEMSKEPIAADELLTRIGLGERGNHFPAQLSGGEQQRVAIARALAKNPQLLLCDEPTGALDVATGIEILKLLKDFCRTYGKTVAIITHNSSIADIGDRVFYIRDGLIDKIVENENPIDPGEVVW